MIYSHKVKFGGKYYQAGEEVPEEVTRPKETEEAPKEDEKETKKAAKK